MWQVYEPIHAVVYFAPEPAQACKDLGLRGWWMGYFAGRFAPLGAIGPEAVTAMAFGFAPAMVARSLPDAWSHADPHQVMVARSDAVADALRSRLPAGEGGELAELAALLWAAVDAATFDGRPLAAAWSAVPRPADPVASLWLATTVLREHRGDGHVLANVAAGVSGLEAGLLHEATGAVTREALQPNRGWTDEAWERAGAALRERGLLRDDGLLTAGGLSLRREIEATTDRLAAVPLDALGAAGVQRALELATPLARHVIDAGVVPVPNPIGVARP
jgi:hypothetical protein